MIKVLLIDDERSLLETESTYLRLKENIDSEICESPLEALDLLKKNSYDLIVSDYDMPEINGIELLHEIRKRGYEIPFILFTGKSREEIAITALNSGVDYYIQKKGNIDVIFTEMAHIIRKNVRESKERERESQAPYKNIVNDKIHKRDCRDRTELPDSPEICL